MKKLLISLLMLCSITAAWAGAGFGTFDDPYSGEWDSKTLGPKLLAGDYLKYDCNIKESKGITVNDLKLDSKISQITRNWTAWAVANPLAGKGWDQYIDYVRYNPDKESQMFLVTEVKYNKEDDRLTISGFYTGHYDRGDGSKDNPYWGEWTVAELKGKFKPGDYLANDCKISGDVNVTDTKLNRVTYMEGTSWSVGKALESNMYYAYTDYLKTWNSAEDRKNQMFILSLVNVKNDKAVQFYGHYTGTYPNMLDADGYYQVGSFYGLKKAIELGGANAKIKLTNDIYVPSSGDITLSSGTFSGEINGICYVPDMVTGVMKPGTFIIHGSTSPSQKECNGEFFNALKGAKLEYLTIRNIKIPKLSDANHGLICRTAENTLFRNIIIQVVDVFGNTDNVGLVAGTAKKCTFDVVTVFHSTVKSNGQCAGCLVGKSEESTFQNCMTDMSSGIWADGTYPNAFAGGFVGYSVKDTFVSCLNSASVGGFQDEVGGFVGYSNYSRFTACHNAGQVAHCDGDEFDKMVTKLRETLRRVSAADIEKYNQAVMLAAGVPGTVLGVVAGVSTAFLTGIVLGMVSLAIIETCGVAIVVIAAVVAFLAVYYGITKAFNQFTLDDELGGIAGRAEGGSFDSCSNTGHLVCKQSYGGGIVGIGFGVTITNCMNADVSEFDETNCGSIIGQANSYNGNKTRVANCFSEADYPVIGDPNGEVSSTSTNNYRHYKGKSDRRKTNEYEVEVSDKIVKSGILARWLNNSAENRAAGVSPWRQNLATMEDVDPVHADDYPTPNASHHEVAPEHIALDYKISDADELIAFATAVNSSTEGNNDNQFLRAALMNDIDMTNKPWTPIGKNESYKQFRGFFDGRGHTIKGLTCTSSAPVGLFGTVHVNAEIMNVNLDDNCNFTCSGDAGAGGIVGAAHINWAWGSVVIENCGSSANINVNKHGGGILGHVDTKNNSTVRVHVNNCYSNGIVTAKDGDSGLLCGYTQNSGTITNSWSGGELRIAEGKTTWPYSIINNNNQEGEYLVGYDKQLIINNCYVIDAKYNVDRYEYEHPLQKGVTDMTKEAVRTGELTYKLNGNTNDTSKSLVWQQDIHLNVTPVFGSKGIYYTGGIEESSYGTICLPYSVKSDDKVKYYKFVDVEQSEDRVGLVFEYAETVEAGTPAIYFSDTFERSYEFQNSDSEVFNLTPGSSTSSDWTLTGTFTLQNFRGDAAKSIYSISGKGILKNYTSKAFSPFQTYFQGPDIETLTGKTVSIVIKGENDIATSISLPSREGRGGSSYTIMGTKAPAGYKGIVIQNGRKYVKM